MLQNKDIAKTQEMKTFFKDTWGQPEFLIKHLELLNFSKTSKLFRSGVPFWELIKLVLALPFMDMESNPFMRNKYFHNRFDPRYL